jgi:D-alanyl-D-alanine carboxypeptidase (penicillin-binding protein 5/6)
MTRSRQPHPQNPFRRLAAAGLFLAAIAALAAIAVSRGPARATGDTAPAPLTTRASSDATGGASPAAPAATRAPAPRVKARSGIVIDRRSGKVLWSKRADLRLAPASCTKIMTALLVLERYDDLDRMITAPGHVRDHQGVAIGLQQGDRISVQQALRALMTKSANDACVTLATAVSGSESRFVRLMNRRAAQLGLTNTRFVNSSGAPKPGHYSSARDLAKLGRYAMRDARFRDLVRVKTRVITWPPAHEVTVTSHNRLLDYPWGDGIKTGATKPSKMVLVGSGRPGLLAVPLIVVTMREPDRDREEKDAVALFEWAAGLFEQKRLVTGGELIEQLEVTGGEPVGLVAAADLSAAVRTTADVIQSLRLPAGPLPQPPADGTVLGTATYRADGVVLGSVDLVVSTATGSSGP